MPPLVRAGLFAALLAVLAVMTDRPPKTVRVGAGALPAATGSNAAPSSPAGGLAALCPRGTLPDGDVCVPVPLPERAVEETPGELRRRRP
jgi:hypothetical protein